MDNSDDNIEHGQLPNSGGAHPDAIDPDGFTIATFLLAAVSAGAGVFSAYTAFAKSGREHKSEGNKRKAAVHRWEAELFELRDILKELRDVLQQSGSLAPTESPVPLRPFASRLLLEPKDFQKCKRVLSKLIQKTQKLHDTTFRLVELMDSPKHQEYLGQGVQAVERQLNRLHQMESLNDSLDTASETVESLLKTAEYLRNDLI